MLEKFREQSALFLSMARKVSNQKQEWVGKKALQVIADPFFRKN